MNLHRYDNYKTYNYQWLNELPVDWGLVPFSKYVQFQEGPGIMANDFKESGVPLIRISGVQSRWATLNGCNFLDPEKVTSRWNHFRLEQGDLLISASASMGTVCEVNEDTVGAIAYTGLIRLMPDTRYITKDFLRALVVSKLFSSQIDLLKEGSTIQHFGPTHLEKIKIPLPSIKEQKEITSFINLECEKVDQLINEKENLISLLNEKLEALTTLAVTRGLNSNSTTKESGVEWLGSVPKDWNIFRLANIFKEVSESGSDELPILSVSIHDGVSDKELDDNELDRKVSRSDDRSKYKKVKPGDLVYNMMRAWQGGFGTVVVEGQVSPAYVVARPQIKLNTFFIEHLLRSPRAIIEMKRFSRGITDFRLRLYWEEFRTLYIAFPSEQEQTDIVAYIKQNTSQFDSLIAETKRCIDLLKERRAALISSLVAGGIDVWKSSKEYK